MNMRKISVILAAGLILASAAVSASAQSQVNQKTRAGGTQVNRGQSQIQNQNQNQARLRAGEAAIYLRSGDLFVDRIIDISSTRLVLETANSGEFPLRDVWMVNYINEGWDFPEEREQQETNEHYIFLRDGGVIAGRIIDFSSAQLVYEMRGGEKIAPGRIRRIYFSRQIPSGLAEQENNQGGGRVADAVIGTWTAMSGGRGFQLQLQNGGGARLTGTTRGGERFDATGRWGFQQGDNAIVVVNLDSGRRQETLTFGRDGELLIGIVYDKGVYGNLRLRRR
jgi:hypothetical protein